MRPAVTHVVSSADLARFLLRARLVLPPPLSSGSWSRVRLPLEEVVDLSQERYGAPVDPVSRRLAFAVPVLRAPRRVLLGAWRRRDVERTVLLVEATCGAILIEDADTEVTVREVDPAEAVSTFVAALPSPRPARMSTTTLPVTAMTAMADGLGASGLDRRGRAAARAAGIGEEDLRVLLRVQQSAATHATVGAVGYTTAGPCDAPMAADVVSGAAGSILKTVHDDGTIVLEPADAAALFRAARSMFRAVRDSEAGSAQLVPGGVA